jgi:hypothetical protein
MRARPRRSASAGNGSPGADRQLQPRHPLGPLASRSLAALASTSRRYIVVLLVEHDGHDDCAGLNALGDRRGLGAGSTQLFALREHS